MKFNIIIGMVLNTYNFRSFTPLKQVCLFGRNVTQILHRYIRCMHQNTVVIMALAKCKVHVYVLQILSISKYKLTDM